jgi:hypothetical protein
MDTINDCLNGLIEVFIPIGHLDQGIFFKNYQLTCGPCAPMYGPCVIYELTNSELRLN